MIYVMYPWVRGIDRFNELYYSIKSLRHLQFEYEVVIVGDDPGYSLNYHYVPHQCQWNGKSEEILRDAISKLQCFLKWMEEKQGKEFIRMYDDIYVLRDISYEEIKKVKIKYQLFDDSFMYKKLLNRSCSSLWWDQLKNTYNALKTCREEIWNTESHCPELFEAGMMDFVINQFGLPVKLLLTSTLYHNYWRLCQPENMVKTENVRAGCYGREGFKARDASTINQAVEGKYFLNHNDAGLTKPLENWIKKTYS